MPLGNPAVHTVFIRNSKIRQDSPSSSQRKKTPPSQHHNDDVPKIESGDDDDDNNSSTLPTIHRSLMTLKPHRVFVVGGNRTEKATLMKALRESAVRFNRIKSIKESGDPQHVIEELFFHSEVDKNDVEQIFFKPFVLSQQQSREVLELGLDQRKEDVEDLFLVLIVYSEKDDSTIQFLQTFLPHLRQQNKRTPVIVVSNKTVSSGVSEHVVSISETKLLASSHNCKFIEVSAKEGDNVDELLFGIGCQLRFQRLEKSRSSLISIFFFCCCCCRCSCNKSTECDDLRSPTKLICL